MICYEIQSLLCIWKLDCEISFVTSMTLCSTLSICVIHEYDEEMIFCAYDSSSHYAVMYVLAVVMSMLLV